MIAIDEICLNIILSDDYKIKIMDSMRYFESQNALGTLLILFVQLTPQQAPSLPQPKQTHLQPNHSQLIPSSIKQLQAFRPHFIAQEVL